MTSYHQAVLDEIETIKIQLSPLSERLQFLNRERERMESKDFITANKITRDDVQMSSGEGIPWHGNFYEFGNWMQKNKITKRWCEWNGYIFNSAEAMNQRMGAYIARVEDL